MSANTNPKNRILAALPKKEYQRLFPRLEKFELIYTEDIYHIGKPINSVYFPDSGIVSLLSAVEDKATLEVGIVGNEGMVGIPVFLGSKQSDNYAVVQGNGLALKMSAADFLKECALGGKLPQMLQRYTYSLLMQISQSAVCNRYHTIKPRLARWLLMSQDRMQTDEFQITQEFLSNMLGVRREAVNQAARSLQEKKLISYSRGLIKIFDRPALEKAACQCYRLIKESYDDF